MHQLPNELLSRVADFAPDKDLLSLRLTCKLLESITYKHFIAAFFTKIHFSASLTGIQRLEKKVAHPKFGSSIRTIMASVTNYHLPPDEEECRALLKDIFVEVSRLGHGLRLGVTCYPSKRGLIFVNAEIALYFARLMFDARPSESPLERFTIDLRQLPPDDNEKALRNCLNIISAEIHDSDPFFMQSRVDILLLNRGQVMGSSLDSRLTITEYGTCVEFNDLEHSNYIYWATIYWAIGPSVRKVQIKNCKLSISTLETLVEGVESSCWHLILKDCYFKDRPPWMSNNALELMDILCDKASGLNSCLLSNLTSEFGPMFASDIEASNPHEIREHESTIHEQIYADEGDY